MTASADSRARVVRLSAFVVERFLPIPTVVMILILTWCSVTAGVLAAGTDTSCRFGPIPSALLVGVVTLLLLFRLRVFDDVKDAEFDREFEQDRPIPRGLVTEGELNGLAVAILMLEGVLVLPLGHVACTAWAIATIWTMLMRFEFFCGEWLEARPTLYANTHVFSGAPIALFGCIGGMVVAGSTPNNLWHVVTTHHYALVYVSLSAYLLSLGFEFGRKFPRYLKEIRTGAWVVWSGTPVVSALLLAIGADRLGVPMWGTCVIAASALVSLVVGIVVQRRVAGAPAENESTIELVPGVLGLLVLLCTAVVLTVEAAS